MYRPEAVAVALTSATAGVVALIVAFNSLTKIYQLEAVAVALLGVSLASVSIAEWVTLVPFMRVITMPTVVVEMALICWWICALATKFRDNRMLGLVQEVILPQAAMFLVALFLNPDDRFMYPPVTVHDELLVKGTAFVLIAFIWQWTIKAYPWPAGYKTIVVLTTVLNWDLYLGRGLYDNLIVNGEWWDWVTFLLVLAGVPYAFRAANDWLRKINIAESPAVAQ